MRLSLRVLFFLFAVALSMAQAEKRLWTSSGNKAILEGALKGLSSLEAWDNGIKGKPYPIGAGTYAKPMRRESRFSQNVWRSPTP